MSIPIDLVLSRREERRNATLQEIKDHAWRQMEEKGPAALSLREISRAMRMSSAALFRYYRSRDELLKALSSDAFQSQVDALEASQAPGAPLLDQVVRLGMAYRDWAVQNPIRFALVYGSPIPGYQPDWDELVPVAQPGLMILLGLIQAGLDQGLLRLPPTLPNLPSVIQAGLLALIQARQYPISLQTLYLGVVIWARIHGLISLELNGQLGILVPDPAGLYRYEVEALVADLKA
jgi:AcrR family transcriptional regulator